MHTSSALLTNVLMCNCTTSGLTNMQTPFVNILTKQRWANSVWKTHINENDGEAGGSKDWRGGRKKMYGLESWSRAKNRKRLSWKSVWQRGYATFLPASDKEVINATSLPALAKDDTQHSRLQIKRAKEKSDEETSIFSPSIVKCPLVKKPYSNDLIIYMWEDSIFLYPRRLLA